MREILFGAGILLILTGLALVLFPRAIASQWNILAHAPALLAVAGLLVFVGAGVAVIAARFAQKD